MIDVANMTSPEIRAAIEKGTTTAVYSVGSNEQHGPVLGVRTDTVLGDVLALRVAEKLGKAHKYPTVNVGCSEHHMKFPGTLTLRKETLQNVLKDITRSLARHGYKRIIVLPSHGGNFGPIEEVSSELKEMNPGVEIITYTDLTGFVAYLTKTSEKFGISPEDSGAHAGESEVSMMLYANPAGVRTEKIPEAKGYLGAFDDAATEKIFREGIGGLSPIGVLGDPAEASKEHGEAYIEAIATAIVEYIKAQ
ncbi:MAG: creatininase family protein [Candidatus Bathyarchaeota archaeon]|nr:creatininase family protein [Candidatus Bathyarchaeota archaeon]